MMKKTEIYDRFLVAQKYEKKLSGSPTFFKKLLREPDGQMLNPFLLFEFVNFYTRFFDSMMVILLERVLTRNELESKDLLEFKKNFKPRNILQTRKGVLEKKHKENLFTDEQISLSLCTIGEIFSIFDSSRFGEFHREDWLENRSLVENLENGFISIIESRDFQTLQKRAQEFDVNYNRVLLKSVQLFFFRRKLLTSFLTLKN